MHFSHTFMRLYKTFLSRFDYMIAHVIQPCNFLYYLGLRKEQRITIRKSSLSVPLFKLNHQ